MTSEFFNKVNAIKLTETERAIAIDEALWSAKLKKMLQSADPCWCGNSTRYADGCRHATNERALAIRNGLAKEYQTYISAQYRCQNEKATGYKNYGGRGIEFRFHSFHEFFAELGKKPSPAHSINRIDNDGHYEKGNVEWATATVQVRNRRPRTRSASAA